MLFYASSAGLILFVFGFLSTALIRPDFFTSEWIADAITNLQFVIFLNAHALDTSFKIGGHAHIVFSALASIPLALLIAPALNGLGRVADAGMQAGKTRFKWLTILGREFAIRRARESRSDSAELFLHHALSNAYPVIITLKSQKVYVGKVIRSFNPAYEISSIELMMIRSGIRSTIDQTVSFTTDYKEIDQLISKQIRRRASQIYRDIVSSERNKPKNEGDRFRELMHRLHKDEQAIHAANEKVVIVPFSEIQSMHPFTERIFETHQDSRRAKS